MSRTMAENPNLGIQDTKQEHLAQHSVLGW